MNESAGISGRIGAMPAGMNSAARRNGPPGPPPPISMGVSRTRPIAVNACSASPAADVRGE